MTNNTDEFVAWALGLLQQLPSSDAPDVLKVLFLPQAFGNALLDLRYPELRLRIVCDRSEWSAQVGPSKRFGRLADLCDALDSKVSDIYPTLESLVTTLRNQWQEVVRATGPDWAQTKRIAKAAEKSRAEWWRGFRSSDDTP